MPGTVSIRELQACYYYSKSEFQGKTAAEKKPFAFAHSAIWHKVLFDVSPRI